jgi:dihydroorotase
VTNKDILIRKARIIDPVNDYDAPGDILISDGIIKSLGEGVRESNAYVIDASGLIACPGFIDLHCHLREPGFEHKETIASGAAAAAYGGFTTVCCMPNTSPPIDNSSLVEFINKTAAKMPVNVLPVGCITRGRAGKEVTEMAEMAGAGCIGFSDDGCSVVSSRVMAHAMEYAASLGLPIIEHCEDPELSGGGQVNDGWVAVRLGLKDIPAAAEEAIAARDIALAEMTGVRLHLTHISTARSVDLVRRAKAMGLKVTCDVTPHHLTLTEESIINNNARPGISLAYDTSCKVNPPLRTAADIQAMIIGLNDGTINCIATDHAPHATEDKLCEFESAAFGISGFETAFGVLMSLVRDGRLTLNRLIRLLTSGPAEIINSKKIAIQLKPGSPADLVLLDTECKWKVDSSSFLSRGRNTPYQGHVLRGKVMCTFHLGQIVYQDSELRNT